MSFKLNIVTPKGLYKSLDVDSLTIELTSGYRTILTGHAPLIGSLSIGEMHVVKDNVTSYFAISGGAINVKKDEVIILTNSIEQSNEIDVERATKALQRATNRINNKDINLDVKRAELALKRAANRIKVSSMH